MTKNKNIIKKNKKGLEQQTIGIILVIILVLIGLGLMFAKAMTFKASLGVN